MLGLSEVPLDAQFSMLMNIIAWRSIIRLTATMSQSSTVLKHVDYTLEYVDTNSLLMNLIMTAKRDVNMT